MHFKMGCNQTKDGSSSQKKRVTGRLFFGTHNLTIRSLAYYNRLMFSPVKRSPPAFFDRNQEMATHETPPKIFGAATLF